VDWLRVSIILVLLLFGCNEKSQVEGDGDDNGNSLAPASDPCDPWIEDDYTAIADIGYASLWGSYNLHDPTIIKHDSTYYIFSTDVAYGPNLKCGIMHRKSYDLVHWGFLGWVFDGIPDIPLAFMETHQPGYEQLSIWVPS